MDAITKCECSPYFTDNFSPLIFLAKSFRELTPLPIFCQGSHYPVNAILDRQPVLILFHLEHGPTVDYESLNANLRLVLLTRVSKQFSDPKICIVYCGNAFYLLCD
jgi:hypothetical protein